MAHLHWKRRGPNMFLFGESAPCWQLWLKRFRKEVIVALCLFSMDFWYRCIKNKVRRPCVCVCVDTSCVVGCTAHPPPRLPTPTSTESTAGRGSKRLQRLVAWGEGSYIAGCEEQCQAPEQRFGWMRWLMGQVWIWCSLVIFGVLYTSIPTMYIYICRYVYSYVYL